MVELSSPFTFVEKVALSLVALVAIVVFAVFVYLVVGLFTGAAQCPST